MLPVRDKRFELLSIHTFPECDSKGEQRDFCEEQRAVERGMGEEIAGYYQFYNRCMNQMLECSAKLEAEAVEAMKLARAEARKAQILAMGKSESMLVDALTAKEGTDYLRSTLPPKEEGVCQDMAEVKSCLDSVKGKEQALREELRKEDDAFDQTVAASIYREARELEASCYEPEFSCLSERAKRYGATGETVRTLKQNIEILKQRERLALRVSPDAANRCKARGVSEHQNDIISAYTVYAKQPVLYFRQKLHKAFLSMHRDQVACLRGQPVAEPAQPHTPAAPPPKKPAGQPPPQKKKQPAQGSILQAKR